MSRTIQAGCVAIDGRAVLILGEPGLGKSSLALALIDRGGVLVGDDGVTLAAQDGRLIASPPPNIAGLIEVRNVGLITLPTASGVPVALALMLDPAAERLAEAAEVFELDGASVPMLRLWPGSPVLALRAEAALRRWGLSFAAPAPHMGATP
ncbi:MAG: HPr kinase/phosphatase C-terminal domain-containing protein [Sphingomonadaceae bacterium]|nr:HPr kinase/phosphatase C-terminal domain-containing protein [Sphingomonadaceae bacterium]